MLKKIIQLVNILDRKDEIKLIVLFFMMIIAVLLEVISIASILPLTKEFFSSGENLLFLKEIEFLSSFEMIYILIVFFLLIYFFKFIYLFFFYYTQNKFINNLSAKLTSRLFNTYLFKDYEFHTQKNSSVMVRNLVTETKLLCSSFVYPIFMLFIETTIVFGILIFLFNYQTVISMFTGILFITLILIYFFLVKKKFLEWGNKRQNLNNLSLKLSLQGLNGVKEIMIYSKEKFFRNVFGDNEFKYANVSKFYTTFQQLPRLVFEFIIILFLISLMFFLKYKNLPNNEIFEILGVFSLASIRFIPSASRIIGSLQLLRYATPSMDVILQENLLTKQQTDEILKKKNKSDDYKFLKFIKLKDVSFKFQNKNEFIFEKLNLGINKNEIIGIYGPSGSGKSTFADLLSGLLKPSEGEIFMDDQKISNNIYSWRNKFGYVTQNVYLLDDTIKNNILFGDVENYDTSRLERSIKLSQLSKVIENLPNGIETTVGERGSMLSGGQIQRIGIARALYHESDILIFDESTNALDINSEEKIIEEIKNLKNIKTIIMISHKMSILKICDKVYELKNKTLNLSN